MKILFILLLVSMSFFSLAQPSAKKSLTTEDFAAWQIIPNKLISNDGNYVVFEKNPLKGDGELIVKGSNDSKVFQRGYKAQFGSNNDFVVYHIKPPVDTLRKAKIEKLKKEKMPKDSLGIWFVKHNELFTYPKVESYKIPEENARWIACLFEAGKVQNDTTKKSAKVKQPGDDLVLFGVQSKDTIKITNTTEYAWAKKGSALICVQQTKDSLNTYSTLKWFDAELESLTDVITTQGWIKNAILDENGEQCAFLMSKDTTEQKVYSLHLVEKGNKPTEIVTAFSRGMPVGWSPGEHGKMSFSEDCSKIYFGTAESPVVEPKDTLLDEDKPKLDIWNWKDAKLQPQQLLEAEKEKKRNYLGVYTIQSESFVQLADLSIPQVSSIQKGNGDIAFGTSVLPYQRASSWSGAGFRDYYLIDLKTGIKREILKAKNYARLSPQGKFVIWWEPKDSSFYCMSTDINQLNVIALTKKIPVSFYNEWHDTPSDSRPYGVAGWSEDDRFVYIYDRYDIWKLDPTDERVPVCVTKAFGRRNQTRLRYEKLDKDLEYIPSGETILLNAIDERTMSSGYFSAKLNTIKDPGLLMMDKYKFGDVQKAKEANRIIWTKQNVKTFPDVWLSNLNFDHAKKMSDANPQQNNFIWPEVELVEWTSFSGKKLKGLLYKPENLKADHEYPMIVYFYERNSETMHTHVYPKPSQSTINKTFYTSNNYLVFVPDITYNDGYPGQSAYDAIVSGTQYLINKYSFVDRKRMGLQGQSWGGYQTAWLITQTDMFAAAMAGAPVSNMTSAYGGIRWGSGMSRMFQYEHTQSRIGGTLWEKPLLYIENSPVFHAPKVNTPLLMMHNDKDGSVPWYQGIEMFVALRRLDKPVWLLNYNGEDHNLPTKSWANRMDLSKRMMQFFDHYLKKQKAPEWMETGVSAVEKGKNLGY
jgi:dipeptidyl aminopeptidase/acylaminoacyl peptidase